MSKKMLKRSLALGALMAFVITGSAMAAELENGLLNGTFDNGSDSSHTLKDSNVTITLDSATNNIIFKNTEIVLKDGETLTLISTDGTTNNFGMLANADFNSGKGTLILNQTGWDHALGDLYGLNDATNIIKASKINITANSYGIYLSGHTSGTHTLEADEITINSKSRAVYISSSDPYVQTINLITNKLTINSDRSWEAGKEDCAITANGKGSINVKANQMYFDGGIDVINADSGFDIKNQDGTSTPDIIQVTGNVKAEIGSLTGFVVDGEESFLKGTINTGTNENADITFSNSGSWENTGVSKVNELILDGGIVDNTASSTNQITVGTLSGEGTLKVADATENQMKVADAKEAILKVTTDKQDVELADLTKVASTENGTKSAAKTVAITGGAVYDEISAEVTGYGTVSDSVNKTVASANVSINDMVAIGMMSWRAEMNDMNKRMGELRNANGEHGVWVRMVRGESEYNSVKNQYNQYQLGYDEKLSVDKRWTVGAAISYTDAENNFAEGNGESTNKVFSVYGSKLNDDGTFVDLIAKYARLDNDFKTLQGQGAAEYDTNAYSFSAEVGKRIQQGKGLWIEPQVELTYGKVSAVDYVTDKGVNVAQDGMESLVGRIGFSLGKDIEKGNVYARASYLYDFDGETKATLNNDAVLENDLGGGWWEVGVGANINLSKATYIYADVEKTFGGEVDTNWQWNLGVRYSF